MNRVVIILLLFICPIAEARECESERSCWNTTLQRSEIFDGTWAQWKAYQAADPYAEYEVLQGTTSTYVKGKKYITGDIKIVFGCSDSQGVCTISQ